jgi:hypothetical protein
MDRSTLSSPDGEASSSSSLPRINGIQNLAQQFRRLRGTNSRSLKESLFLERKFDVLYSKNGKKLCIFCYNLDEAAFQNHASFIRALKDLRNSGCKTCLMIKRGISQFISVGRAEDFKVEISAGAEDGVMILVAGLKLEFFTILSKFYHSLCSFKLALGLKVLACRICGRQFCLMPSSRSIRFRHDKSSPTCSSRLSVRSSFR